MKKWGFLWGSPDSKRFLNLEPKENERWAEEKPKDPSGKRLLEIKEEPGLSNSYVLRRKLNILFFQNLQKHIPEWPRPLKKGRIKKEGWGFEL